MGDFGRSRDQGPLLTKNSRSFGELFCASASSIGSFPAHTCAQNSVVHQPRGRAQLAERLLLRRRERAHVDREARRARSVCPPTAGSAHKRSGTSDQAPAHANHLLQRAAHVSMRAMKTITEFSGGTLRGAAQTRDRLKAEGVGDEALPERVSQESAVTGDRAARLIEALSVVGDRADRAARRCACSPAPTSRRARRRSASSATSSISSPTCGRSAGGGGKRKGGERGGRGGGWARPAASAARGPALGRDGLPKRSAADRRRASAKVGC